jgi:toxin ParE1/3/4
MYRLTEAAADDIEGILTDSFETFGAAQTEAYVRSLHQCLDLLGAHPEMGYSVDYLRRGYRRFPHQSHVVFYTKVEAGVLIVRILHQRMDVRLEIRGS